MNKKSNAREYLDYRIGADCFEIFKEAKANSLLRLDKGEEMLIITNLGEKTNAVFGKYYKFEVIYKEEEENEK